MSSLRTKSTVENDPIYGEVQEIDSVPKYMRMDYSRIHDKPFLADTFVWDTTTPNYSVVRSASFPTTMLTNTLAQVPFLASALYRMSGCLMVQVSGSPLHQGLILVSVMPGDFNFSIVNPNQLLMAPHAFLSANESTPVCIEMPYYARNVLSRTKILGGTTTGDNPTDHVLLVFYVMSPLRVATGARSDLTVTTHVQIKKSDFYIPKITGGNFAPQTFVGDIMKIPTRIFDGLAAGAKSVTGDFIDSMRAGLRHFTGFHNPNSPAINSRVIRGTTNFVNNVDQPTLYEKLDPFAQHDRIVKDCIFNSKQDEMDISYLLSKPAWIGRMIVNTSHASGKVLANIPITPMIETASTSYYSPMRLLYDTTRYWRGGLKLHIQCVSTNFHFTKLLVVKDYSGDARSLTQTPTMDTVHNLPSDTLEFSAGGQIQTIDLPFCSQSEQLECTGDPFLSAISHGIVHIYLLQPLVTSGNVPTSAEFNIYMSGGQDLQFYGYNVNPVPPGSYTPQTYRPQTTAETAIPVSGQEEVSIARDDYLDKHLREDDFRPIVSVRDIIRRVQLLQVITGTVSATKNLTYELQSAYFSETSFSAFHKLYHGSNGGVKMRVEISIASPETSPRIKYLPPGLWLAGGALIPSVSTTTDFTLTQETLGLQNAGIMRQDYPVVDRRVVGDRTITVFEFVIPNMNHRRFYSPSNFSWHSNLGRLLIHLGGVNDTSYTVKIYAGSTDETRLGYQVLSPGFSVPVVSGNSRLTMYDQSTPQPTFSPRSFPGLYYFNNA